MYPLLKQASRPQSSSFGYFAALLDHSVSKRSLLLSNNLHAQLIKSGFIGDTFLCNRCLDLYFKHGTPHDARKLFDDITCKNTYSWNICLKGLLRTQEFSHARTLFDEMPERDVVSWNSMISGSATLGFQCYGLRLFSDMQKMGVTPSEFTFSILTSLLWLDDHGRQVHGNMICRGMNLSNVVLGNSLIDMYGRLGLVDYAFVVFMSMEELDVVSWNSLISGYSKAGLKRLALNQFVFMRSNGYEPDEYTVSTVTSLCSELRNLEKGKQIFALCVKVGFLANTIVSSAIIDMLSKCNRFLDSIQLFEGFDGLDSALCNTIIGCYANHGLFEDSLRLFILTLHMNVKPTAFTISTVLSSISALTLDCGNQVHGMTIKLGFGTCLIVASSVLEMYSKTGFVDVASKIFETMKTKDLISWNSMILGLAQNGRPADALNVFHNLIRDGESPPDQITFSSVLLACCCGGFVDEAIDIFLLFKNEFKGRPTHEHYASMVALLCRVGMFKEALDIINTMPFRPSCQVLESVLCSPVTNRDLDTAKEVAEKIVAINPTMSSYLVLAKVYESSCQWENLVRVRYAISKLKVRQARGRSWIAIRNHLHSFVADQLEQLEGSDFHSTLSLLMWEVENEKQIWMSHEEIGPKDSFSNLNF